MHCPQCQQELVEEAAFCNHCGFQLQAVCQNCHAHNPPGSRYCHQCGSALGQQANAEDPALTLDPTLSPAENACPRCETLNEPTARYCYRCGLPLERELARAPALVAFGSGRMGVPAGFWVRLGAFVVDTVTVVTLSAAAAALLFGEGLDGTLSFGDALRRFLGGNREPFQAVDLFYYLLDSLYFTLAVALWQTTVGKRLFFLYVTRTDGRRVGVLRAFVRNLATGLSMLLLGLGFLMIAFRRDKRGLHDLICDTRVIRRHATSAA